MIKKIIGWALLSIGLIIIFWSLYSSYNIFTAKSEAPEVFKITEEGAQISQKPGTFDVQEQMEEMMGEQLKKMLPTDFLPKLFNLIAWSIFAGILIFGGVQVSNLGIKLIK